MKALIDVSPAEFYEEAHIRDAINICVYEGTFLSNIKKQFKKTDAIVLYGPSSEEGKFAAAKLKKAGYKVSYLIGGLNKYRGKIIKGKKVPEPQFHDEYIFKKGKLHWKARSIANTHHGELKITNGGLLFKRNKLKKGFFEINMNSIVNLDLKDKKYNKMLVNHLKSDDFFDVKKYPIATCRIKRAKKLKDTLNKSNYLITSEFIIKGKKSDVFFYASIHMKGRDLVLEAHFDIDRTKWGVIYGSSLLKNLGMHAIRDDISLEFEILLG